LLLLGARRQEIAEMPWREVDEQARTWELPADRSKTHANRLTPLPDQALAIIARQPHVAGPHVFFRRGGHSAIKLLLDAGMRPDASWRVHDLRRTCASGLQKLGINVAVTEAILGHKGNTFNFEEKRAALQMWANRIDALVKGEGAGAKVVQLGRRPP
jgi:integrase